MQVAREQTDHLLLLFSGGKDSLVLCDLASKEDFKLTACYFYLAKGLSVIEKKKQYAQQRWGITDFIDIPSPTRLRAKRDGIYCLPDSSITRNYAVSDMIELALRETGLEWAAIGFKKADSFHRHIMLKSYELEGVNRSSKRLYPLTAFSKEDVYSYCKMNNIIIPSQTAKHHRSMGVSLHPESLRYLKQYYPSDFVKIKQEFPLIEAVLHDTNEISEI